MKTLCPRRGEVVWLNFDPQAGHEQAGRRPALVLSPDSYNEKSSLILVCAITSLTKGYPFELLIPPGYEVTGWILADHVRSVDWRARRAERLCKIPDEVVAMVLDQLGLLVHP